MNFCLFWSIETDFRSIENCKWVFLKVRSWHVQSIFFKKFSKLSSLSLRLSKAPRQFFVVLLLNFCKVFLSISRYVHYTPSFSLIFCFTCIFFMHWRAIFRLCINWGFLWFKPNFVKLINGFCWYTVIFMIYVA